MTVAQELSADVETLRKTQLADAKLAPVVKAFKERSPHLEFSYWTKRLTFSQDGLLCHKF